MTIQENVGLAQYTTLGVGGPARWFCRAESEAEVVEAVLFARERGLRLFVLGGGSNLLVSDAGFDGLVVQVAVEGAVVREVRPGMCRMDAPAGMGWDEFVTMTSEAGFSGVECLAGIPGLVGGTPVQNVGAYGQEVAQTIVAVRVFDLERLEFRTLQAAECGFAYRQSVFNTSERGRYVVVRVVFELATGGVPKLRYADLVRHFAGRAVPGPREIAEAVRSIRRSKGMLLVEGESDSRSAGSFFKNPVVAEDGFAWVAARAGVAGAEVPHWPAGAGRVKLAAAWLVERAGFAKGFQMGRAGISTKHTLALVNLGGATAEEIVALRDAVVCGVDERFGVRLEQEPVLLGF